MDRLRRTKLVTTLLALLFTAACGTEPVNAISHTIEKCGEETEVDVPSGKTEEITADKNSAQITYNADGTVTINGMTMASAPNEYFFGDITKNHLSIKVLGDKDNDGKLDVSGRSDCPAPPATPTPEPTPFSLKGSQRFAGVDQAFHHGKAINKPFAQGHHGQVYRRG